MTFKTLDVLLDRFADFPPERVRLDPAPGTATVADVVAIEDGRGPVVRADRRGARGEDRGI